MPQADPLRSGYPEVKIRKAQLSENRSCGAANTGETRYVLQYAGSRGGIRLQGLRVPPGSCKLLKCLMLGLWHGRGHRFDPGQVHQYILQKTMQCKSQRRGWLFLCASFRTGWRCNERREAIGEWGVQVGLRRWRKRWVGLRVKSKTGYSSAFNPAGATPECEQPTPNPPAVAQVIA